ncbi:MAG: hypothetical protein AW10_03886 [Candidatus Accumulibacter appositus]|uniref:DUF1850 domain-containing protein n=1 Tax=Candidatus Accumulibacter appositus TaxID=1454003 RepID=A0A011PKC3_9PROT|nr:DUF1850 domain-containing protein [Accumulibacter sp.]EXI77295.1 MAG: hypothetical protein AW10_03886 [Candidatus Accumulibacter appositus]HRF06816.1 DUF1850 domain-containing protein [Accumulibacter sp.]
MPLCLSAGAAASVLAVNAFTLAWTHSIEKTRWEEDWRLEGQQLHVVAARIVGSGAGMEPPADAILRDGIWHYRPSLPPLAEVLLSHSPYAGSYQLCVDGVCQPIAHYLPGLPRVVTLLLRDCANEVAGRTQAATAAAAPR